MDRQLVLAIALSAVVVIAYQEYLRIYYPESMRPHRAVETPAAVSTPSGAPRLPTPQEAVKPEESGAAVADVQVETDVFRAGFSSRGGRLVSMVLKHYRTTVDPKSPLLELVSPEPTGELPLGVTLRGDDTWSDGALAYRASSTSTVLHGSETAEVVFRGSAPGVGTIEKRLRFDGARYAFGLGLLIDPASARYTEAGVTWAHAPSLVHSRYAYQGAEALVGGKLLRFSDGELAKGVILPDPHAAPSATAPLRWAGYADTYFLSAILPREGDPVRLWAKLEGGAVWTEVLIPLADAHPAPYPLTIYTGPKDLSTLAAVGHELSRSVALGWFGFIAEPMLRLLKAFHRVTGNYGLDIILLTMLVKVLFIPLTQKSYRSMQELQKLQPQMKKLQEKYKEDRAALNREVMELYRRHKVNPLGGCLPMVLQMPIFIGLYNALLSAVELRHARFALWINDLSAPDRLPPVPNPPLGVVAGYEIRIPVLTVLMGVSMLIQQRMTPQAGDPAQQRMMMFMPLVFTVMFVNFPSGLVLYWLVNNVLTITQQAIIQRGSR